MTASSGHNHNALRLTKQKLAEQDVKNLRGSGMFKVRSRFDARKLREAAQRANFASLTHAAAAIRLTARRSIRRSKRQSSPGRPPHTRAGQLKRAILYAIERQKAKAIIGPSAQIVGTSGHAHEFGGRYRREVFPKRAFMGPALMENLPRLPKFWRASVK